MRIGARRFLIVITLACNAATPSAHAVDRRVADFAVSLDGWTFVPTLAGSRVESFAAERAGRHNSCATIFRLGDREWRALAPPHPMLCLGTEELPGAEDLLAELVTAGWSDVELAISGAESACGTNELLSAMAAIVEADVALGADGALASHSIPPSRCDEWISLTMPLQPDGTWTVPDLAPYIEATTSVVVGDGWQSVASGTVLTGPQTVVIDGGGIGGGGQQVITTHLVVTTKDVSEPSVTVQLHSSGQPFMSPSGGHPYFVAPAPVTAAVAAIDAVDGSPIVSVWHNGTPSVAGVEITEPGIHTISVLAADSAGNQNWTTHLFEIRTRRQFGAEIHVADIAVTEGVDGIEHVATTVRITSPEFDVKTLNPGTIDLWLVDEGGAWIEATGGYPDLVDYEDCHYEFVFAADFAHAPLQALPPKLVVTGRGLTSTASEYDFVAGALAQIDDEPFVHPCEDPGDPEPPDSAACEWQIIPGSGPAQSCTWANFSFVGNTPGSAAVMAMWVTWDDVTGSGYCWITVPWPADVYSVCSKANGGTMNVFLSGDDCCSDCTINVVASPKVTGTATVDPLGSATVSSTIAVGVGGTGASASGSVSLSNDDGGTITINNVPIPIGAGQTTKTYAAVAQPPLNQNFQTCSLSITIATAGTIDTNASTSLINWYGAASGSFKSATPGLTITPQTNCSGIVVEDPIVIDYGP